MKKILLAITAIIILAVSVLPVTAFAWDEPELMLATDYNMETQTITLYYRVMNFAGTESADFRLRYNPDVVEYISHETAEMSNTFIEVGHQAEAPDTIAIQFVDLYYAEPEDCEEDASATIVTFTFKVKDEKATETVFISYTDSYAMDPNSTLVSPDRATHKISLNKESHKLSTSDNFVFPDGEAAKNNENIKKIIVAASVTAAVFVGGIVVIVVKYRKK